MSESTKSSRLIASLLIATGLLLAPSLVFADAPKSVTVFNFVRAESDMTLVRYVAQGAFGKFFHIRQPTPIDKQDVIRMNRDTLYSLGVFDLTEPVTITKPDGGDRYQSMHVINQDHSMLPIEHGPGDFMLTKEKIGTRYVLVLFRTFVDPSDAKDVGKAHALQDGIKVKQADPGSFGVPDWEEKSLGEIRDTINVLATGLADTSGVFGDKDKLDPIRHLLGTAFGWGGLPEQAAFYLNVTPDQNDGTVAHTVTVKDVPVDGFWSITVYNALGFMEENDLGAYSYNNVTAKPNADGSITIHLGGDPGNPNYLPIVKGWNYTVRLYRPRKEILDGSWKFPPPKPVK